MRICVHEEQTDEGQARMEGPLMQIDRIIIPPYQTVSVPLMAGLIHSADSLRLLHVAERELSDSQSWRSAPRLAALAGYLIMSQRSVIRHLLG